MGPINVRASPGFWVLNPELYRDPGIILGIWDLFWHETQLPHYFADLFFRRQTFTCFVILDLVSAIQNRGLGCGLLQNKILITTVSISFITQLGLVYIGFMQKIFKTDALGAQDLGVILALAGMSFSLHEGRRWVEKKKDADEAYGSVMEELA